MCLELEAAGTPPRMRLPQLTHRRLGLDDVPASMMYCRYDRGPTLRLQPSPCMIWWSEGPARAEADSDTGADVTRLVRDPVLTFSLVVGRLGFEPTTDGL